jgi:hypothetical protein
MSYRAAPGALLACAAALFAQQSTRSGSGWTVDLNGRRVENSTYSVTETPAGGKRVELRPSHNGRMIPVESTEDKVIHQDSRTKIVERVIQKYDGDGRPTPPVKVRIEEKKNPDGTTTIQSTAFQGDVNGNLRVLERSTTQTRQDAAGSTSTTTVELPNINGSLQPWERTQSVEKRGVASSRVDATTYRRDVNGGFSPIAQEVKQITRDASGQETTDSTRYETIHSGKLEFTSRTVERVKKNADGSEVAETDVYSRFSAGRAGDVNADAPRLQEQVHRERKPGPGGVVVETTSVRARVPNDPSRFGNYEQVSQVTYTSAADGKEVRTTTTTVGRRDPNGQIIATEGGSGTAAAPKPPAAAPAKAEPAQKK